MQTDTLWTKPWVRGGAFFGTWTLIGLLFASQFFISSSKAGIAITWTHAIVSSLSDWYVFALLSWPVRYLVRQFPLETSVWQGSLMVHLPASVLFSLAYILIRASLAPLAAWWHEPPVSYLAAVRPLLLKTWYLNLLVYWVIFAVSHAFDYYRKYQDRELRAIELEKRLAEARLHALQMQLNPHFLFNTLNAISSLMHQDIEAADRMIARLSGLLRQALDSASTQEVSLSHELRFLRDYLVIEQTRFGDRLTVALDAPPDTQQALVPNLMLQPLVENAIIHGLEPRARPGRIEFRARRDGDYLNLEVRDNGAGLPEGEPLDEGVGLSNTRARLQQLYGPAHRFELASPPEGGLAVRLRIPFRIAEGTGCS
jgi:signal transduction histidine kinase